MNKILFLTVNLVSVITLLCVLFLNGRVADMENRIEEQERVIEYQRSYIRDLEMRFVDKGCYEFRKY